MGTYVSSFRLLDSHLWLFRYGTIEAERHREFNAAQPSVSFLQTPAWGRVKSEWRSESLGWFNGTTDLLAQDSCSIDNFPRSRSTLPTA